MFLSDKWKDYELIDASRGEKLESWGGIVLRRPDPQIVWTVGKSDLSDRWRGADAHYIRSSTGGGHWETKKRLPESWTVDYGELTFGIKMMGFKHTGLFPEQAVNWDWFSEIIRSAVSKNPEKRPRVLNMFAYTGGATAAAAAAGADVCHVDASRGMVNAAKENLRLSGLGDAPVRYIVDDCKKFAEREKRRGKTYDGIIMDPPSYGRGPNGELWKLEDNADELISLAASLLSEKPLFFLINSYTTGLSPASMGYMLVSSLSPELKKKAAVETGEIGLPVKASGMPLPAGASARCTF